VDTPVEASSSARPLINGMRAMFIVSCVTVSVAGFQLFVLTEYTDRFFAWTIDVPLTAAFLGACYWGSFALVLVASRQQAWARARIAVPGVWLFTVLTLIATLIHIDLFRMDSVFGWAWLVVYVVVPGATACSGYVSFASQGVIPLAKPLYRRGCGLFSASKPPSCLSGGRRSFWCRRL
jgi:hypothetical protein